LPSTIFISSSKDRDQRSRLLAGKVLSVDRFTAPKSSTYHTAKRSLSPHSRNSPHRLSFINSRYHYNIPKLKTSTLYKGYSLTVEPRTLKTRNIAVEAVITSKHSRLFGFIRKRVKTDEDAEDILQDVFYQLLSNYNITEPIEKLSSWFFAVARNRSADWYRRRITRREIVFSIRAGSENGLLFCSDRCVLRHSSCIK